MEFVWVVLGGAMLAGSFSFFGEGRSDSAKVAFEHHPECEVSYPAMRDFTDSTRIVMMPKESYGSCSASYDQFKKSKRGDEEKELMSKHCPDSKSSNHIRWAPKELRVEELRDTEAACIDEKVSSWKLEATAKYKESIESDYQTLANEKEAKEKKDQKERDKQYASWALTSEGKLARNMCISAGRTLASDRTQEFVRLVHYYMIQEDVVFCNIKTRVNGVFGTSHSKHVALAVNTKNALFEIL
ncbi:hypothetical protein EDB29_1011120 [Vibrio crassostreae]|uniref:hypothetical protein n=1 Tax=Vibrio crassostreae TaxID=246167 RepID=UPI0010439EDF|nr:hypothetical protein [Vibrio crassostreae]CAH6850804.1 hypothetical protein VCHA34P121_10476 [Vibrio chagasii]TCT44308.1 hypothetical protein EDB29_1011120 [Vibrio crassostreae]CAH6862310.1 hypothetical protein VCHA28FP16_10815 [Vibrio chagasii]CAH6926702.1 hypothetical protein VCHA48P437_100131 [Vibrio chagasii]CAH6945965.1 hypothetical protein VCHA44O286_110131 [Vibrio chagasii]